MAVPTLDSAEIGKVETIQVEKFEDIFQVTAPTDDSDETILEELSGAGKVINVKGIMTGSNVAALKVELDRIQTILDGDQAGTVAFTSDITGSVNVVISSFSYTYSTATRVTADYSMTLIEGSWSS
jgi:hypothetical protein